MVGHMEFPSKGTQRPPEDARRLNTAATDSPEIRLPALPSSSMDVATHDRMVDVAGMPVFVRARTHEDLDMLGRVLGERPVQPDHACAPITIELGHRQPAVPARMPDFAGPYGDHWVHDGTAHFRHHWGLNARIDPDVVELGGPARGYRRWVAIRNSMLFVLAQLYMQRGSYLLHSAALHRVGTADRPPSTVLVLADSGRGKSTLTYAALRAGMQVMGDDMIVVTPSEAGITAQGVPRVLTVPTDVLNGGINEDLVLPGENRKRVELVGERLYEGSEPITAVMLCDHDSGAGRLDRSDVTDVVEALAAAFVLSALPDPMRMWFPTAMSLAGGPHLALLHASDPAMRVERAVQMLGDATGGPLPS